MTALRRTPAARTTVVTAVVAALCLPAAVADAALALDHSRRSGSTGASVAAAPAAAVSAARQAARDLLSYDYRSMSTDVARAEAEATGVFAAQYRQTAAQLTTEARQNRAIVQATPGLPGVVSATPTQVVVLVFVDQASVRQLHGATSPTTRIDQSRVLLTMSLVHGRWLVSQLSAL